MRTQAALPSDMTLVEAAEAAEAAEAEEVAADPEDEEREAVATGEAT